MTPASLRIALVYDDSLDRYGGIPRYLTVLAGELREAGHDVTMLVGETASPSVNGCQVHSLARNVHVRFNGNRLSMPVIARRSAIRSVIDDGDFDVVHVQVPYSPLLAGYLIRRLPERTALVGTFHVASERALPTAGARALAALTPGTRSRFDRMICVSSHAAAFARATYGIRDPAVIPNMIAASPGGRRGAPDRPTVGFLGALVPRKGPAQLIDAFALAGVPRARLRIAGDGPLRRSLERRARRLGLGDAVEFLGAIDERDKSEFLRGCHVACFPSRYGESFGIVILEAIAADGPVVLAGDNAGYRTVLGSAPFSLCSPRPAELARRLAELLGSAGHRQLLAAQQRRLLPRYDARLVTADIVDVYARALADRRGGVPDFGVAA